MKGMKRRISASYLALCEFEDGPRNGYVPQFNPLHYLYRGETRLFFEVRELSWGKIQGEPATNRLDWSFAPILTYDERFARQYRYKLPPKFPKASLYASIARRFSGRITIARSHLQEEEVAMREREGFGSYPNRVHKRIGIKNANAETSRNGIKRTLSLQNHHLPTTTLQVSVWTEQYKKAP